MLPTKRLVAWLVNEREGIPVDTAGRAQEQEQLLARAWTRSRACGLDQGAPLELPFHAVVETDNRFTRTARPVLDYLGDLLPGCGTAAVLLDAQGSILARLCDDASLMRRMDSGNSLPGFVWREEFAGCNAVGIVLEERVPAWTSGQDHYMEALRDLSCAAAPIINPLNQRLEGVLDLTANLTVAHPLMLPLAIQAAKSIEDRLVAAGSVTEQLLLRRFLEASRRPGQMVLVLSERSELSTKAAARRLSPSDRAVIAHAASEHVDGADSHSFDLALTDGGAVSVRCETIEAEGRSVGSVVTIASRDAGHATRRGPAVTSGSSRSISHSPGFLGRSSASQSVRADAGELATAPFPILISGESGVGKVHLAGIIGRSLRSVILLDARTFSEEGEQAFLRELSALAHKAHTCVIVRNIEGLSDHVLRELGSITRVAEENKSRVIATATSTIDVKRGNRLPIGIGIHIPPLRERPEDIWDLAPALLARKGSNFRTSAPVLEAFMRYPWPGNVSELDTVLSAMLHRCHGSELTLADLPVQYHRGGRRLRRIEHVERAAIVQALAEAGGNRTKAAGILEIGRATLYRKMRVYGLGPDSVAI
jgi:transcriptional regulator of acetoin/glycerol metabolism